MGSSPAIGIRESRRVVGDYQLARDDVLTARRFEDEIALCGAPIEDHGPGCETAWEYVPGGAVYGIPFRCLLPRGIHHEPLERRQIGRLVTRRMLELNGGYADVAHEG